MNPSRAFEKTMLFLIGAHALLMPSGIVPQGHWTTVMQLVGSALALASTVFGKNLARRKPGMERAGDRVAMLEIAPTPQPEPTPLETPIAKARKKRAKK